MLADLKQFAQEIVGTTSEEQLTRYINRACQELYDTADLPNALWEAYFTIDLTSQLVTLPWYVGDIRGVRRHQFANKIQVVDARPRYHYSPWRQPLDQWRIVGNTPLHTSLSQAGLLTVTIDAAESEAFTVRIRGQTTQSQITSDTLTFPAGTLSVTTTKQFTQPAPFGIIGITKSRLTDTDVRVKQAVDNVEVALVPNCLTEASNKLIQVHDGTFHTAFGSGEYCEILFKWPFIKLQDDEDMFLGTNRYDQAVIWKLREVWHSSRPGEEEIAIAAAAKGAQLMAALISSDTATTEKTILDTPNPVRFAPLMSRRYRR